MPKALRLAIFVLLAGALVYLFYASSHTAEYRVEVCVDFAGRTTCRTAAGRTREAAERAAHDNACADLTSGVTGTIQCANTPARSVKLVSGGG
jgi:hypothetical protein